MQPGWVGIPADEFVDGQTIDKWRARPSSPTSAGAGKWQGINR
jgi:hypothetical protein